MAEHQLTADQVEHITARIPESGAHTVNDREMPDINLQYIFAVTLLDGKCTFEAAHSFERMSDARVLALRKKVTLVGDPELTRAQPEHQAIVQVVTRDGRKLEKRVVSFKGKAENPLTTAEVEEKAEELLAPVLGTRARQLIDTAGKLETLASMRDLRPLLRV
jgi:2-methylcitrate dehydratase PrpD